MTVDTSHGFCAAELARETKNWKRPIIWEGLAGGESIGALIAGPKAGKSIVAMNAALALVGNKPFLGHATKGDQRVLLVSLEVGRRGVGERLNKMAPGLGIRKNRLQRLCVMTSGQFVDDGLFVDAGSGALNDKPFERLAAAIKAHRATVVIVDPLYVILGEENNNIAVTNVMRRLQRIVEETGASLLLVHHTAKGKTDWGDLFHAGRGASSLGGFLDWALGIERKKDSASQIHHGSRYAKALEAFKATLNEDKLVFERA